MHVMTTLLKSMNGSLVRNIITIVRTIIVDLLHREDILVIMKVMVVVIIIKEMLTLDALDHLLLLLDRRINTITDTLLLLSTGKCPTCLFFFARFPKAFLLNSSPPLRRTEPAKHVEPVEPVVDVDIEDEEEKQQKEDALIEERRRKRQAILDRYKQSN